MIITIDGPAGSGKSTLSVLLAQELGFFCLNSGYLYRGIAYVLKTFYAYSDEKLRNPDLADINACIDSKKFRYDYVDGLSKIYFGDDDITQFLKRVEITKAAAIIAQNSDVRKIMLRYERALVQSRDTIVEGRACGSSQFPDADIKLYVTASVDVRAKRETFEQIRRGNNVTEAEVLQNITARDKVDMDREQDPLIIPQGAIIVDTTELTQVQMVDHVIAIVKKSIIAL